MNDSQSAINQPAPSFVLAVVVVDAKNKGVGKYLKQGSSYSVRKYGYGFTANPHAAWHFPSIPQALAKAKIVCRHMEWNLDAVTIELVQFDDDSGWGN
jgi:hypothetical protein